MSVTNAFPYTVHYILSLAYRLASSRLRTRIQTQSENANSTRRVHLEALMSLSVSVMHLDTLSIIYSAWRIVSTRLAFELAFKRKSKTRTVLDVDS